MGRKAVLFVLAFLGIPCEPPVQDLSVELLWEIGGIDGPPEVMWQRIVHGTILGNSVYIVDVLAPSVRQFTLDGDFEADLGRAGEGPGEFFRPWFVAAHGDSVGVYDSGQRRWSFFSSLGEHLSTLTLPHPRGPYTNLEKPLPPGIGPHVALTGGAYDEGTRIPKAAIVWTEPTLVDTLAVFRSGTVDHLWAVDGRWHYFPWNIGDSGTLEALGDSLFVVVDGMASRATVYARTEDGVVARSSCELPGRPRQITGAEVKAITRQFHTYPGVDRRDEVGIPDTIPAWTKARASDPGTVWLKRGGFGGLFDGSERWVRWSLRDGSFTEVSFPDGVQCLDFEGDFALGLRQGEFDEQYIQLLRITETGTDAP
jgi:hypothetical protein